MGKDIPWSFQKIRSGEQIQIPTFTNVAAAVAAGVLVWTNAGVTEGEDYVFELTVTEAGGVVTVTTDAVNVGFS